MKNFFNGLFGKEINQKFKNNADAIRKENAKTLNIMTFVSFGIFVALYVLNLIFNIFAISGNYLLFFIGFFLIEIILILCKVKRPGWLTRVDIFLFMIIAYTFAILVDNYLTKNNSRSLFLIFMLVFSVVFVEKPWIIFSTTSTFFILFVSSSYFTKDINTFALDAVYGIITLIISSTLIFLVLSTKLRDMDINRKLDIKSNIDELSGLFNRRSFNLYAKKHEKEFISTANDISVIMFDIDYFKNYNDTYGHLKGDEAIVSVARILKNVEDKYKIYIARYGGEEFVAILKNKNLKETKTIAKEIITAVKELKFEHKESPYGMLTISAGCASKIDDQLYDPIKLLNYADQNLYKAKIKGKNRVE